MEPYYLIERPVKPGIGWFRAEWLSNQSHAAPTESIRAEIWTADAQEAIKFCRREDAEAAKALIFPLGDILTVTENLDHD